MNDAQKKYARKLALQKTIKRCAKEALVTTGTILFILGCAFPLVAGIYCFATGKAKLASIYLSMYLFAGIGIGLYPGIKSMVRFTKDTYRHQLRMAEREVENSNGLEKASITAKHKE